MMIIKRDMISLKSRILLDIKPDEITTSIKRLSTGIHLTRSGTDRMGSVIHKGLPGARNPYSDLIGLLEAVETVYRRGGILIQKMRDILSNVYRGDCETNEVRLYQEFSVFREDIVTLLSFDIARGVINRWMTVDELAIRIQLDNGEGFAITKLSEEVIGLDRIDLKDTFELNDQILRDAAAKISREQFRIAGWRQRLHRHHQEMGVISQNTLAQGSPITDFTLRGSEDEAHSLFKQLLR